MPDAFGRVLFYPKRKKRSVIMTKHKILIPLDGSKFSQQILAQVRDFFNPADHELILLRVALDPQGLVAMPPQLISVHWPTPMYQSHRDAELAQHPIYACQVWDSQEAMLEYELRTDLLYLRQAGFIVSTAIRFGDPVQEILNLIIEEKIDLIAMTSHGRTGLSQLMFGSVAEKVLHAAAIPVMILHPKAFQGDASSPDQGKD
jgi:nucleotide-binding universal stress UspA family protein